MMRSLMLRLLLLPVVLPLLSGCPILRNTITTAREVAETASQRTQAVSLDDLKADVEKPAGAAEIVMAHLRVEDPKDQDLAAFNVAFCADLSYRVTRLPQVRGQVPGWVLEEVMKQQGWRDLALEPQRAMKLARLSGRRYAFTGAVQRWEKVFAKEPDHAESHMGLAVSLKMLKDDQKALGEARKAIAADAKVGDPKYLAKERYWPEPLAQAAAELASAAREQ